MSFGLTRKPEKIVVGAVRSPPATATLQDKSGKIPGRKVSRPPLNSVPGPEPRVKEAARGTRPLPRKFSASQYPIKPQQREHTGISPSVVRLCRNLR